MALAGPGADDCARARRKRSARSVCFAPTPTLKPENVGLFTVPEGSGGIARRTSPTPRTTMLPVGGIAWTVGTASVIKGSPTTVVR